MLFRFWVFPDCTFLDISTKSAADTSKFDTCTVTVVKEHGITVTGGTATVGGTAVTKAVQGTVVQLTANIPENERFARWETISGSTSVTFENANSSTTTFTMPDGSVAIKAVTNKLVNAPIVNTGLVYNSHNQIGVNANTGYILGGTYAATNAGSYTATATLDTGYIWADGSTNVKSINWSISKADQNAPTGLAGVKPTAEGANDGKITGVNNQMEYRKAGTGSYSICTDSEITGLVAGNYEVRFTETVNFNASPSVTVTVPAGSTVVAKYTLTITNGSGSGDYAENTAVTITANAPATDKVFDKWVLKSGSADIADENSATTTVTTKATAATIEATYKDAPPSHTHSYGTEWKYDASNHWHECECGDKADIAAHSASEWIVDTAATESADGAKHKECTVCKKVLETATIPATGSTHTHSYGTEWKYDDTNHWHECECGDKADIAAHSASEWIVDTAATKTADGAKHKECTVCKKVLETATIPATGSGSTGGGGGGSSVTTYAITVKSAKNGDVTASRKSASKGTTVTLTVDPDKGYVLDTLTVLDSKDKEIKLTEKNGKYTFTMPDSKVTVEATFKASAPTGKNPFIDVPAGSYYEDAVIWAVDKGITTGTSATTFNPNGICTRAQAVTFLWRAAGSPAPKTKVMPFADVKAGSYYYDAVLWAVEQGITKGSSETMFSPDATCTRAQIVTFLWRANGSPAVSGNSAFTDVAADAYYAAAVKWAEKNDITGGIGNGLFGSGNTCTRAQIVTFLYRAMK